MKIRKAVGALVFQDDEYIVVHKIKSVDIKSDIKGHWDLPKGGVQEADEDLEKAIFRELKEETGLLIIK
jgi:putative (di)nucleoside polyphosphate hydrolase